MSVYLINKSPFSVQIFYISIKLQPNGNPIAIGMQKMSTNLLQLPHELSDAKLTALTLMIDNQINTLQIKADISTIRDTSLKKYFSSLRSHFKKFSLQKFQELSN